MRLRIWLVLPLMLLVALTACNQDKIDKLTADNTTLKEQNDQLMQENEAIKSYIDEVSRLLESVGGDIAKITETEVDIQKLTESGKPSAVQGEVKAKLGVIGKYIIDSREKISGLEKQLEASKHDVQGLKTMVANLKTQLEAKEAEVASMAQEIGLLQADVERLGIEVQTRDEKIATQETIIEEANKRYYVFDKEDVLKEKNIIQKTGGVLGLGKSAQISPAMDTQHFTVIDMYKVLNISIPAKADKIKIISPHKADSYQMEAIDVNQTTLKILDPVKFWASSKCLVIVID